ncbi:glycosyltransferase family 2 protein [Chryseobacterium culicis]|uniref:Glycosyl transferase family 2 n=1 Tax=Chryseobacterium culicis TaxID=680127 RepID=A0A2S9D1U9_CHRCI|nr:glycosyltransferase family 2 protein [Chryseobacterium culicis]PRB86748.1 glycosyl transferase family 2 [Chryseobacterium culicis]PRB92501.1 glycosyl transferase family 2 [Chryseobacterium culicis]
MINFSILIANYNNGNYFKECYDSLINQTYENWEAIIIDDASTDNSVEIIQSLIKDDSRFKLYHHSVNEGCGSTKAKCMKYAQGDLCAYLDPDDALYPEALEKVALEFMNRDDLAAVYSQMMICNENLVPEKVYAGTKQIYNNRYFFNCPIQFAHLFIFKRKVYLRTAGINATLKNAVDQDLYLKILEQGEVKYLKEPLYLYRLHSNGISQDKAKQSAKESFARVIHDTMKRRGIKTINHKVVPEIFTSSNEIFELLNYQTNKMHRLISKIKVTLDNI